MNQSNPAGAGQKDLIHLIPAALAVRAPEHFVGSFYSWSWQLNPAMEFAVMVIVNMVYLEIIFWFHGPFAPRALETVPFQNECLDIRVALESSGKHCPWLSFMFLPCFIAPDLRNYVDICFIHNTSIRLPDAHLLLMHDGQGLTWVAAA
jgi:hypothetical protein